MKRARIVSPAASPEKVARVREVLGQLGMGGRAKVMRKVFGRNWGPVDVSAIDLYRACRLVKEAVKRGAK